MRKKNCLDIVGIRLVKENEILTDKKIRTPEDAVNVLANELKLLDREVLMSINLNNKNKIINAHIISIGGIDKCVSDPKSIFKSALLSNSTSILLIHNHPSGECTPSQNDIDFTKIIKEACFFMGIKFLDHIIIGDKKYYSIEMDMEESYNINRSSPENNCDLVL